MKHILFLILQSLTICDPLVIVAYRVVAFSRKLVIMPLQ